MLNSSKKSPRVVMLVCGSGIISSVIAAPTVESILQSSPYNCELIQGKLSDIKDRLNQIDLLLTTVALPKEIDPENVPVVDINGLFSGEEEKIKQDIMEKLQES